MRPPLPRRSVGCMHSPFFRVTAYSFSLLVPRHGDEYDPVDDIMSVRCESQL